MPADRRHAARVALGLLAPGLVLLAVGRPELVMYAAFGSFAGMYGRLEPPAERLRHQFHGAGMLVTGVGLGALLSAAGAGSAVLVLAVTAFATLGSLATDGLGLRPGGPFFGIFALGATASVGPDLVSPLGAVLICAGTASWCLALGVADRTERPASAARPAGLPAGAVRQAGRYLLATSAAGVVGVGLGIDHANWAMTAAAVPLAIVTAGEDPDVGAVLDRAAHRVAGTLAGLAVTAVLLLPEPRPELLAVVVIVLLFPTELFLGRHYGLALGFFTPLIMVMTELAAPSDPVALLLARGVDTLIGVAAGVAAAALVRGRRELPALSH
ncbi:FUSC family protein [Nocardioides nitrophenolicus]|uniref:FUSC family protein n=1 Tax=Nocardioides nitrophenolicus TaxID=60489 RepID=UPI001EF77188|nr:FUSC family protein [Nocardioides nitrophenolicus]MBM7519025.1 putative membrane protein YccC [Nocardioides nitrophenolicus]